MTKSTTVVDLLAAVLAETSDAKMADNPLKYFAYRGALLDLSKSYSLTNVAVKNGQEEAVDLRDQLQVLVDKYIKKVPTKDLTSKSEVNIESTGCRMYH
jgi:hypothetical protein